MNFAITSPSKPKVIRFSAGNSEHFLSIQYGPVPVEVDGERWPSAAHYFFAQMFASDEIRQQIKETRDLSKLLKQRRRIREDWNQVRDQVMEKCNRAKFSQNAEVRAKLFETAGIRLVAEDPNDAYFGDGIDGRGENRLGILLAQIRESLIAETQTNRNFDVIRNLERENGDPPVIEIDLGATVPQKRRKNEIVRMNSREEASRRSKKLEDEIRRARRSKSTQKNKQEAKEEKRCVTQKWQKKKKKVNYVQMMEILDNALERIQALATELNDGKTDNDEMYESLQLLLGSVFPRSGSDPFLFNPNKKRK